MTRDLISGVSGEVEYVSVLDVFNLCSARKSRGGLSESNSPTLMGRALNAWQQEWALQMVNKDIIWLGLTRGCHARVHVGLYPDYLTGKRKQCDIPFLGETDVDNQCYFIASAVWPCVYDAIVRQIMSWSSV